MRKDDTTGTDVTRTKPGNKSSAVVAKPLRPLWLDGWLPGEKVPESRQAVETMIREMENSYSPAPAKQIALLLDQMCSLWGFPDKWDEINEFYFEAFDDVPLDLAEDAFRHVRLNCKFFPKPAELREPIREELVKRQAPVHRLQAVLKFGVFEDD